MTWTACLIWCGLCVLWLVGFVACLCIADSLRSKRQRERWAAEDASKAAMTPEQREEEGRMAALLYFGIYVPPSGAM